MKKTKTMDLGNFNIKLCDDIEFITTFEVLDASDTTETNILEYDGVLYAMEKQAPFDPEYNKSKKNYMPNLLWGLDKMGANTGDKFSLMLGLPIEALGQAESLKESLEGKEFTYKVKEEEKTITIEKVGIVGEGISSYYMLSKEDREKDLILIDIGGRTCNVVEFRGKKLQGKTTVENGMIDFFDMVKQEYNNANGENVQLQEIYHYMKKEIIKPSEKIEDEFIKMIMNKIKVKFNLGLGKTIIFTGGGSITLKDAIKRYDKNSKFMDNPLYTNVKGNLKLAKAKGWCTENE